MFNHEPTGQAERGKTFYIFNVVQPTETNNTFSNDARNIATTNQRDFYIINDVKVTDAGSLVVQYFEQVDTDAVVSGSLTTNISVIGKPKEFKWLRYVRSITRKNVSYSGLCSCTYVLGEVLIYVHTN